MNFNPRLNLYGGVELGDSLFSFLTILFDRFEVKIMKKIIISIVLTLVSATFSNFFAQPPGGGSTPAGASDSNLRDDNIRMRSVEMERIKREAAKRDSTEFVAINSKIKTKFPEIQKDFEGIQILQAAIIKAYTAGKRIDYAMIATSADEIVKSGKRLDANLFSVKFEVEDDNSAKPPASKTNTIKDTIVELDNAIGDFVASKIFHNLNVFEPEVARKARIDLARVMQAAGTLSKESSNMK